MVNNKQSMEVALPCLKWDIDKSAKVHSLYELNHLIDKLSSEVRSGLPFSVDLHVTSDTCLSLVVGDKISHMNFFSAQSHPPIVGCSGPWDDDELFVFLHRGEYSEIPRKFCVPVTDAREAVRQYFLTGLRPNNVVWNDNLQ